MEELKAVADRFVTAWNSRARIPALQLDYTWPSTGVLDLLTFELRDKVALSDSDKYLLRGVSCYLAVLAEKCWREGGAAVAGRISSHGVSLQASGGAFLAGEEYVLEIEQELAELLARPRGTLSVYPDFSREIIPGENILSSFAISVVTGRSPRGVGPWAVEPGRFAVERTNRIARILGASCAQWYERVFPDELVGQIGELYLQRLIVPPALCGEDAPSEKAVEQVWNFLNESSISAEKFLPTAANLSVSCDEVLGNVGFAYLCGLASPGAPIDRALWAARSSRAVAGGLLRVATVQVRKCVAASRGATHRDYIEDERHVAGDDQMFRLDLECGLLPWVTMRPTVLEARGEQPLISPLLQLLASFDLVGALQIADTIVAETPAISEVRLQRLYLELITGDGSRAESHIRALLTEPTMESDFRLYSSWAMLKSAEGNLAEAARLYKQALALVSAQDPKYADICNDYGWALLRFGQLEDAVTMFDAAIERSPFPITPMLNRTHALKALGREEESRTALARCLKLAPTDRRVFGSVYLG